MWYVYFLELSNGDIYVGSTDDLRRRFASHQRGQVTSTCKYLPATLRSYIAVADELTARRLERYFKSGSGDGGDDDDGADAARLPCAAAERSCDGDDDGFAPAGCSHLAAARDSTKRASSVAPGATIPKPLFASSERVPK